MCIRALPEGGFVISARDEVHQVNRHVKAVSTVEEIYEWMEYSVTDDDVPGFKVFD